MTETANDGVGGTGASRHPMTGNRMDAEDAGEFHGIEHHRYDVLVIGAGGAGLRAAIAAHDAGAKTAIITKSLLGKAHTVMAEGGIAAAMGNRWPEDNWQVHFRDTMRGGKMLNNWRMAQLHAQEAPERVLELEDWGALFDRTDDGLISQRDFGGHRYARLAHVGDRTGLEMIRTLQQRAVALGIDVFMECTVNELFKDASIEGGRISGAFGYWRETGRFVAFEAPSVVLATGGIGKSFKVTSNSWEYTGDGHALALRTGAALLNMEFVQFHPTGMVWPPSVKGILVTESVRGDGGILKNSEGRRFMFDYISDFFKAETADSEEEADRWYDDKINNRRPPELLPRDEVARAINSEIKAGRGSPHGGIYLDIASRRSPEFIKKRLPSMYHQFKELADVDITKEPMEIGPTCHYVMGGIEVDADTQVSAVPGLYAAGECSGGMHGSNRLGGNSLSDLLVFGKRAGEAAAASVASLAVRPALSETGCGRRRQQRWHPSNSMVARTLTRSSMSCKTTCRRLSGSSGPPKSSARLSKRLTDSRSAQPGFRSKATGSTTLAGTSRSICTTCCWCRSALLRLPWSGPNLVADTPATTIRGLIHPGAQRTSCSTSTPRALAWS
jgi:succinate dehydrogenase / fumarate reductase, flavoprotein subunit